MHVNDLGLRCRPPRRFTLLEVDENGFFSPSSRQTRPPLSLRPFVSVDKSIPELESSVQPVLRLINSQPHAWSELVQISVNLWSKSGVEWTPPHAYAPLSPAASRSPDDTVCPTLTAPSTIAAFVRAIPSNVSATSMAVVQSSISTTSYPRLPMARMP